jgi:hypothetical protein
MVKNYSFNKKKLLKCTAQKKKPCINIIFRREFKDIRNKEKKNRQLKRLKSGNARSLHSISLHDWLLSTNR